MSTAADPRITDFLTHSQRFGEVVDLVVDRGAWSSPSACAGWSAADVVAHVVATQRDFLAQQGLDVGPGTTGDPAGVWREHLVVVRRVVADGERMTAPYDGYFGPTTLADTLADFYGFDLLVHRWDLGRAVGEEMVLGEDELDRVEAALDGFGDAVYSEGICAPAVPVAESAPRQVRVLARTGRRG